MSLRFPALVATLAALSTSGVYAADEYQWEVSGMFATTTGDSTPDETEQTTMAVQGIYHVFAPVALATHPYEEASFLEHSTLVSLTLSRNTYEQGSAVDADGFGWELAGRYATKEFPVAIDLSLAGYELSDGAFDVSAFGWELRAGYWIMPNLIAGLGYNMVTTDVGAPDDEEDTEIFAYAKWVHNLQADLDLNLESTLGQNSYDDGTNDDSNLALTVSGDVYFQKKYGVGLNLGTESGDAEGAEGTTFGIDASAWFNTQIGVRAAYSMFSTKDDALGDDSDTFSLEVVGRF